MAQPIHRDLLAARPARSLAEKIADRLSQELVIALVGPVGSGVSTAAHYISEILSGDFGYEVAPIMKLSDIIAAEAHRVGVVRPPKIPISDYIDRMQTTGNLLREKFGSNYLVSKAVEKIVSFRREKGGYTTDDTPMPGRRAYILDSIKNIEEYQLLRQVYGETLYLIGVFAPDAMRKKRLVNNGADGGDLQTIFTRDQGEVATFGQMTRKVFVKADFFICNDQKMEEVERQISRYLNIIFSTGIHTPTIGEAAMYEASAVASKSACMSRQVGAAIVSASGELIALGCNDVPKFGGGLYTEEDQTLWDEAKNSIQDRDHRCFNWGSKICHNEVRQDKILQDIASKLANSHLLKKGKGAEDVLRALAGTAIDSLTEFSRAIHAEMDAILAVARGARHSLIGATLYSTTYPCHNCARHIVVSGIKRVVYIQPYAKSLATELHSDSVTEDPDDATRVVFRQYDGVAPQKFLRLFSPGTERKRDGRYQQVSQKIAVPTIGVPLDGSAEYEAKVIVDLTQLEQTSKTT